LLSLKSFPYNDSVRLVKIALLLFLGLSVPLQGVASLTASCEGHAHGKMHSPAVEAHAHDGAHEHHHAVQHVAMDPVTPLLATHGDTPFDAKLGSHTPCCHVSISASNSAFLQFPFVPDSPIASVTPNELGFIAEAPYHPPRNILG
jgi:hypothetical protein